MPRPCFAMVTSLGLVLALSAPAAGQGISALKQHDIDQAITWEANRSELMGRDDAALLIGDVHVQQGDLELFADRLHIFYRLPEGAVEPVVERLDATGNVRLQSPTERVTSEWGVYDLTARMITLGGGVTLTRGDSRLDGERLEIDLESGVTKLDGKPTTERAEGRVRGRFVLPEKQDGGGTM